jgi:SAM-dependent methyltransferase
MGICVYLLGIVWSALRGAPYVPTQQKEILHFLSKADLKKNQIFIDIGCGDGRVVATAVKKYGVKGMGIDINPLLIWLARFKAKIAHIDSVEFMVANAYTLPLKDADVIYLFLMPEMLNKLSKKIEKECKKEVLIICHGFKIRDWDKYLKDTLEHKPFPTYYYRPLNN